MVALTIVHLNAERKTKYIITHVVNAVRNLFARHIRTQSINSVLQPVKINLFKQQLKLRKLNDQNGVNMLTFVKQALNIFKITAKVVNTCVICGKEFKTAPDRKPGNYCSKECSKSRITYHYTCSYCGNKFTRNVLSNLKRNYCSAKCRGIYNNTHKNAIKMEAI
jgi:endogenous inhibitor of DNA gyrase (YacG/DUF329 family)